MDVVDKEILIGMVIEQMKRDLADGDTTAITEMLMFLPVEILAFYLPEGE